MNYYELLGVTPQASQAEIKSAFKQLALRYHPDRNPGNPEAEEKFKIINEAYHVLSDSILKARYDQKLFNQYSTEEERLEQAYREAARRRAAYQSRRPQSIYDRLGRFGWQDGYTSSRPYKIDKEYFKVQAYTLLLFLAIAGSIMGMVRLADYLKKQEYLKLKQQNDLVMQQADSLFKHEQYEKALSIMSDLVKKYPSEINYIRAESSMIDGVRKIAEWEFDKHSYKNAADKYILLLGYENNQRISTWYRISECHHALGNYELSINALKQIHKRDQNDIRVLLRIAQIYSRDLDQDSLALPYFNQCKAMFINRMEYSFGKAFELVIRPETLPTIYFDIFEGRAKSNIKLNNFEDAYTDCKWALYLKPKESEMYYLRAVCRIATGRNYQICEDLKMANKLGHLASNDLIRKYCSS
jgi:curved DNA-binding protein CbpA